LTSRYGGPSLKVFKVEVKVHLNMVWPYFDPRPLRGRGAGCLISHGPG